MPTGLQGFQKGNRIAEGNRPNRTSFKIGHFPTKGFTGRHHTIIARQKMSKHQKGIRKPGTAKAMRGNKHALGHVPTEEVKRKMSESHKGNKSHLGKHPSEETIKKIREAQKGKKNPNWQGGKSFEPYGVYWTDEYKAAIRQRDNFTCQICGKYPAFEVHHWDYDKLNPDPNKKVILCKSCHIKTNYNRKYWENYFKQK